MSKTDDTLSDATKTILEAKEKFLDVILGFPETMEIIKQTGIDISEIKKELQDILTLRKEIEECKENISVLEKQIKELKE